MYAVYSEVAADRKSLGWVHAMLYRCSLLVMTPSLHCVASLYWVWESVEFQAFLHECYTFVIELRVPHVFGVVAPYRHVKEVD